MKKFFNYFSYVAKYKVAAVVALMAVAIPGAVFASWSPERPTFTMDNPAPYVTFNSITDNPTYGDERPFHDVKDAANTNSGGFKNTMQVEDGQTLLLRAYVHNNAAANLNASGVGVAENTKIKFLVPTGTEKNLRTISYISADNAQPKMVSDTTDLYAGRAFSLDYVEGSARQYTHDTDDSGKQLSDDIVDLDKGATLTSDDADKAGDYKGCEEYISIVTIKVKVQMPEIDLEKTVRKSGEGKFVDSLDGLMPGDEVEYLLKFTNTGSTTLSEVTIRDNLPAHMTYVNDSAYIYNSNTGVDGRQIGNNLVSGGTILSGSYLPDAVGRIVFKATVNEDITDDECGTVTLTNVGIVEAADSNRVQDKADAKVDTGVECDQPEEPETPETPVTPDEEVPETIASTGPAEAMMAITGTSALGQAITSYVKSRRGLSGALKQL